MYIRFMLRWIAIKRTKLDFVNRYVGCLNRSMEISQFIYKKSEEKLHSGRPLEVFNKSLKKQIFQSSMEGGHGSSLVLTIFLTLIHEGLVTSCTKSHSFSRIFFFTIFNFVFPEWVMFTPCKRQFNWVMELFTRF